jgi:diamine N-acetyltransferase
VKPDQLETSDPCFTAVRSDADVRRVAALACEIWREYYVPLLGAPQVEYMLENFQSYAAMQQQMERGDEYFMMARGEQLLGYMALRANVAEQSLFISKLYLHRTARGAGNGRLSLQFIERTAHQRGLGLLWLTVNKHNAARQAYERWGFTIAADIRIDIGSGFVMDDFRMEKRLSAWVDG